MKTMDGEVFRLECDCHDMRCFIGFEYQHWILNFTQGGDNAIPNLAIDVQWHPGNIFQRLKTAWRVIRKNEWHESADVSIQSFGKIIELRDFLNRCIAEEDESRPGYIKRELLPDLKGIGHD